ncbi:hypothetical protein [Streptomyces sp. XD-27]|uniref:hypothetical protein n=1 Tax=Streptomyces sp. XD-27 TaxID=3062779 RepID=UPI0026F471E3|nr:hypothetical protein [Streptomyces sp. XD-27]WKX71445.1 hypothetical protein Q3Y56_17370 [Streptomyces sp. XD-27]
MAAAHGSRRLAVGLLAAVLSLPVSAALAAADDPGDLAGNRPGQGRTHPGRSTPPGFPPRADEDRQDGSVRASAPPDATSVAPPAATSAAATSPAAAVPADPPPYAAGHAAEAAGDPATGPAAGRRRQADGPAAGRAMRVLPLGTGMALAGLGLAYFGLRLRRR